MRIVRIAERPVGIDSSIRNAFIDFSKMNVSTVAVITDVVRDGAPVVGFGFNSNGRYAPGSLMRERFIPRILEAPPEALLDGTGANFDPHAIWKLMMTGEKPGGHGERSVAVGTLDMALWDAVAKIEGRPLYRTIAERFGDGTWDESVFVYAAGGYYQSGKDDRALQAEMQSYRDLGYSVLKMKIGGAPLNEDVRRIEAALEVAGDGANLAVDANGRFDAVEAKAYAAAIAPYGLRWYEEPGDPLDFELLADVARSYAGVLATGENLFSVYDARNLIRYGGLRPDKDKLQFDCALAYGLVEYLRIVDMLRAHGWSPRACIPHGGHQMSLNIAAGLKLGGNESYPGIFQPFGGFADDVPVENSRVGLPDLPGIGFEGKAKLMDVLLETARL
ncbi:MAG: mandelate racemase/muconate lactonizing enzyme family protein [Candidatus Eremiobacteraeota bacterium]|nr:mandelate racemase/muconate lactonizing enzyme family protein [Candidatus Eremiobacteraeota bacterium]